MEIVEVVLVEVDVPAEVEAEEEIVTHLTTRILHAIAAKRKAILLITARSKYNSKRR